LLARITEITQGYGTNLIFDPIAGATLPLLAEAVSFGGQIILYGALGGVETPYPLWTAFTRSFTLRAYTVYNYCGLASLGLPRNEEAFARAVDFIRSNLAAGKLKPVIAKIFPLGEICEAHRYMESNRQLGKIVISI
jgi:NADPH2:quinone reductase